MTDPRPPTNSETAEFIAFEEFRSGLSHGRFRVIVDPALAQRFVAQRLHATPVALALIGPGIALALAGFAIAGAVLVAGGLLFWRSIQWQAGKILLQLASRQPAAYYDATTNGVMEVRRA